MEDLAFCNKHILSAANGAIALLLITCLNLVDSCPSTCVVCSVEAAVCQGLPYIRALPSDTKVLVVTNGDLSSIGINDFSYLVNLTLLRLSGNRIQQIQDGAFANLSQLRILVLDNNQLTAASLNAKIFLPLPNLETLQLNQNYFGSIDGTWFKSTKHLIKLEINKNRITQLTHRSLRTNALRRLEHLDLSRNRISFIHEESFHSLQHLQELDLSRNRLTKLRGVFSSLPHLILLNLGQNPWHCSCDLHELADFLRNYSNSAARILKHKNGLRCRHSSNLGVKSLLQLTERNCVSKSYNITSEAERGRGHLKEATSIAILVLAGAIAVLLIAIVTLVKCNLRPERPSEQRSTRCRCGESQDFPGEGNQIPPIHLGQEGSSDAMLFPDPARICHPFVRKHCGSFHLGYNPKGSEKPPRASDKETQPGSYYLCFNCQLVQWHPTSTNVMLGTEETGCFSNGSKRISDHPRDVVDAVQWQGETNIRRPFYPNNGTFGIKSDNTHKPSLGLTVSETGPRKIGSYKQSADIMSRLTTTGPVEMKIHTVRPPGCAYRSQKGGLLDETKDLSLRTDNDLICKYMDCDKLEKPKRQITEPETQNAKFGKEKILTHDTEGNCFLNNDSLVLSAQMRKVNIARSVGFYIPHIQREPDIAVNTSQSHQEHFLRPHLGSKYLLAINKKDYEDRQESCSDTLTGPLKDFYISGNVCNTKYTKKRQDYLRVKVNLQPFRKVRVHPQQKTNVEIDLTQSDHSPKPFPPQLPKRKSKGNKSKSSSAVMKATTQTATSQMAARHNIPNGADDPIRVGKSEGCIILPDDKAAIHSAVKGVVMKDKGRDIDVSSLQNRIMEETTPQISEEESTSNALSKEEVLNSVDDGEENLSTEKNQNHTELKDPEMLGRREALTETKLQAQCASGDNGRTLSGNVLDTKLSNVSGIAGGTKSLSCGNNSKCEIDIAASSLPGNKVNGHLEGNRKDDITEVGHLLRPDNPIKHTAINEATDREIKADGYGSLADPMDGCEKENVSLGRDEKKDINDPGLVEMFLMTNSQSIPGREVPTSNTDCDTVVKQGTQNNDCDDINPSQQDIESPVKGGDLPFVMYQPHNILSAVENETILIDSQKNEASNSVIEATAQHATTSDALPQVNEQNNSNNNHSQLPAVAKRRHLSLSESSKVIIVVENLNKTVNIQKYLTERSARLQTAKSLSDSKKESDSAPGDGGQRNKICLILPEKAQKGPPKSTSKKIK